MLKQRTLDAQAKAEEYGKQLKAFKGDAERRLFDALDKLGVDLQAYHSGTFVGNHMFKMLAVTDKVNGPKLITDPLASYPELQAKFYEQLILLGKIFNLTSTTKFLTDDQITDLESKILELKKCLCDNFQNTTTTPKMHSLLTHVLPFVKKHRTIGLFTEQAIESLHAEMNCIMR